ncbi:hypothetical protein DSO57_1001989 [Entomophthora muscae]|uniref:Uncharacterized protein n=1 Tax=Entomophthora muscae TaxID=34485 RepID=A0ACC2RNS8_9FUNG|nr:hypothetical protein DSO57_1001989 [Entomophthora muscae]
MRRASDEVKKEHMLTCLHPTCQKVVVPELPTIETWEDMKQLLIDKFGGDLSLEVKKDAFMGNCGKFDSVKLDSLVLDKVSSTMELSAAYVNLLVFLA